MIKKYFNVSIFFLIFLFIMVLSGCSKKTSNEIVFNNDIFTSEIYEKVIGINYWYADEKIVISDKEDISKCYKLLASLNITECDVVINEGYSIIELVTEDDIIDFGLLSGTLAINDQQYILDKDIVDAFKEIAMKYKD